MTVLVVVTIVPFWGLVLWETVALVGDLWTDRKPSGGRR